MQCSHRECRRQPPTLKLQGTRHKLVGNSSSSQVLANSLNLNLRQNLDLHIPYQLSSCPAQSAIPFRCDWGAQEGPPVPLEQPSPDAWACSQLTLYHRCPEVAITVPVFFTKVPGTQ